MNNHWIFCCGPVRSGSTLQFNVTREIIERTGSGISVKYDYPENFPEAYNEFEQKEGYKIFKTHSITPFMTNLVNKGNGLCICCYRDVRDVVVSMLHKANSPINAESNFSEFTREYLEYLDYVESLPGVYISKYESFYDNISDEVLGISKFLGLELDNEDIEHLSTELSFEKSKIKVQKAKKEKFTGRTGAEYLIERKTLLHDNHFRHIHPGSHREYLSRKNLNSIEGVAYPWLIKKGYPVSLKSKMIHFFKSKKMII